VDIVIPILRPLFPRLFPWPWLPYGSAIANSAPSNRWNTPLRKRRLLLRIERSWSRILDASVLCLNIRFKVVLFSNIRRSPNSWKVKMICSFCRKELEFVYQILWHRNSHRWPWSTLSRIPVPSSATVPLVWSMRGWRQPVSSFEFDLWS